MNVKKIILGLALLLSIGVFSYANPPGGTGGPGGAPTSGDAPNPDTPAIPIDGGISLLLAAGAGLGARKLYKKRKTAYS